MSMCGLSYGELKVLKRLRRIERSIHRIEAQHSVETELRAEIAELINAAVMEETEKKALAEKIAEVLARSESVEAKLRSAVPTPTP